MVGIIKSYRNRKVYLIGWCACGQMFVTVIFEQKGPLTDNEPHTDNATDTTADNCKRRAKNLRYDPCFYLPQLRTALEDNLVDARHPPPNMVRSLQLTDCVAGKIFCPTKPARPPPPRPTHPHHK